MTNHFLEEVEEFLQGADIEFKTKNSSTGLSFQLTNPKIVIEPITLQQAQNLLDISLLDDTSDKLFLFEDRWLYAKEQIKQRILTRLGFGRRIFARNCQVVNLSTLNSGHNRQLYNQRIQRFIEQNHSLKYIRSPYTIALEYKENIVAASTFSKPIITSRITDLNKITDTSNFLSFEWTRYVSLPDTTVIGGMGKLLNAFLEQVRSENLSYPIEIMSYSDNEWSNGMVYKKLGFKEIGTLPPIEHYVNLKTWERLSVHDAHNQVLIRNNKEHGDVFDSKFVKIYNMGSRKWLLSPK